MRMGKIINLFNHAMERAAHLNVWFDHRHAGCSLAGCDRPVEFGLTGEDVRLDALVAACFLCGALVGIELRKRI